MTRQTTLYNLIDQTEKLEKSLSYVLNECQELKIRLGKMTTNDFDTLPDEVDNLYKDLIKFQIYNIYHTTRGSLKHYGLEVDFKPFKEALDIQEEELDA